VRCARQLGVQRLKSLRGGDEQPRGGADVVLIEGDLAPQVLTLCGVQG
jgi:hypothetical protein